MNKYKILKLTILINILLFINVKVFSQKQEITVTDCNFSVNTFKKVLYNYGFSKGDSIIIIINSTNNKDINKVQLEEYFSSSIIFSEQKTQTISKRLLINKTGIYCLNVIDNSVFSIPIHLKIIRKPFSAATADFNTNVYWKTINDTIYGKVTGTKTIQQADTIFDQITDKSVKIYARKNITSTPDKAVIEFTLPENTISWSYFIGVGKEGRNTFNEAVKKSLDIASSISGFIPEYGPMISLALKGVSLFTTTQRGDNVKYFFVNNEKYSQSFMQNKPFNSFIRGEAISDFSQVKAPLHGKYYLCLHNDNLVIPIDVSVKITVVKLKYSKRIVTEREYKLKEKKVPYLMK
ncbi:MAG: hypothetical protein Q8880_06560 [Bacteroidota bacterium]|nr:hypothetical protein [Bacteroidota bacterium]